MIVSTESAKEAGERRKSRAMVSTSSDRTVCDQHEGASQE